MNSTVFLLLSTINYLFNINPISKGYQDTLLLNYSSYISNKE